ncbi:anti-sigma-I factor RsgI family protein [Lentibacillus jeotgali]|uniref:anti-sigma-I factor RsgI family protein n=1 Tax=Lentibacillus jeotgali TaxID=558169 RepID=UPI0002626BE0|nr:hypothetical protein [Lentibacillus jeotgali]
MNKGIVMEKHRNYIIVMLKDGTFQKARPLENAGVGTEVSYQPYKDKRPLVVHYISERPFKIAAIACVLLLLMPGYIMMDSDKTYAYVNITINPSVELQIDDHLNVKSIVPLNEDAETFEKQLNAYEGEQLTDVIEKLISESEKADLLRNGKNMLAGVSYVPDTHQISVIEAIEDHFLKDGQGWEVVTMQIPKEVREQAQDKTESMNQLMAISLVESGFSTGSDEDNSAAAPSVDEDDREILHSFYNNINNHSGDAADKKQPVKSDSGVSPEEKETDKTEQPDKQTDKYDNDKSDHSKGAKHPKSKNAERNDNENNLNKKMSDNNTKNKVKQNGNNGKAKGHEKAKQSNGRAKGHDKAIQNKGKGHDNPEQNSGNEKGHDKEKYNNGKAKENDKPKRHNDKAKGHQKRSNGNKNSGNNETGPK